VHAFDDVGQGLGEQVQALLGGEAGNDAEERDVRIEVEIEARLEGGFGEDFAGSQGTLVVGARQIFI
jgi:hypothetical protein